MSPEKLHYRVGLGKADITPPIGIMLSGFASRTEPSTGVYHPLSAAVVAIDDGVTPILLVGADVLGFYDQSCDLLRQPLSEALGIPTAQIVLNASHTHCGPCIRERDALRFGPLDLKYRARAFEKIVDAARTAWRERAPARLRFGTGQCNIGVCRRKPDPAHPGKIGRGMLPYYEGVHDHDTPVIAIETPQGKLRGVIFSYAAHPTSRGGLLAGPDYAGYARDRVESAFPGATACFLQGCGADQKPRPPGPDMSEFGARTVEQVQEIGFELGDAVSEVIRKNALAPVFGAIEAHQIKMKLQTEPLDRAEMESALHGDDPYMQKWAEDMRALLDQGQTPDGETPFEAQTIAFGTSLAVVALAAEATAEHGLRFKRDLHARFKHVLPLGYCNQVIGYIPVRRQIPEGGYEVNWANRFQGRPGAWVESTEEQIHQTVNQSLGAK